MKTTAIIMINWNGWTDTIECLDSFEWPLLHTQLYILDNDSSDDSIPQLQTWLAGRGISCLTLAPNDLSRLPAPTNASNLTNPAPPADTPQPQVLLIRNPSNAGFAGGNNVVLRHLLDSGHHHYAWLLNNDTVIKNDTLRHLQQHLETDPNRAFSGSVLLDYTHPERIQCCGVKYYKYLGVSKLYLKNRIWKEIQDLPTHPPYPVNYYQIGASLLVDLPKLQKIGLMDEIYFLYSEEADWQIRAKTLGFTNSLAWESVIYHKGNMSTAGRRHLFFYHYNRSAIILTRKNFGRIASITATISLVGITLLRTRFRFKESLFGIKGLAAGWKAQLKTL